MRKLKNLMKPETYTPHVVYIVRVYKYKTWSDVSTLWTHDSYVVARAKKRF